MECICRYCGRICKNDNSLRNHERLCKENPDRQILKSNFIAWNEFRRGKNLQKSSNQYKKAKELGYKITCSAETRQKLSKASTGRKHTEETKRKISQKMRDISSKNPSYSNTKYKYTEKSIINGYHLDSSWERLFAEYLIENNIKWNRPKESFQYIFENKKHIYHPDFYLPEFNRYVEIKGQETKRDLAKYEVVKDLIVLRQLEINKIKKGTFDINEYL